jgi:hypothetical protein
MRKGFECARRAAAIGCGAAGRPGAPSLLHYCIGLLHSRPRAHPHPARPPRLFSRQCAPYKTRTR